MATLFPEKKGNGNSQVFASMQSLFQNTHIWGSANEVKVHQITGLSAILPYVNLVHTFIQSGIQLRKLGKPVPGAIRV